MAIYNMKYITEVYKSKYADLLDDDEEENEDDDDNDESSQKKNDNPIEHLSKDNINKIKTIISMTLSNYPKLKKCCDNINLDEKDHINDDGVRESPLGEYLNDDPDSYIELLDGDVFSGYPNFKDGGNEAYEKDEEAFVKDVNKLIKSKGIKAKFMVNPKKDDEAIGFGVKSIKEI